MNLEKGIHNEVIEAQLNKKENASLKERVNSFPLNSGGASFKTHKLQQHVLLQVNSVPGLTPASSTNRCRTKSMKLFCNNRLYEQSVLFLIIMLSKYNTW